MKMTVRRKPDFLMIGAQKSGTTWLWEKLKQHPGTDLPKTKEIQYFGGVENFRRGADWYYAHFKDLDPDRVTGEGSTTYFYDRIPYWFNEGSEIEFDASLPAIPEIVHREMPDARILVTLRDPVHRALSAYRHWMRKGNIPPHWGLRRSASAQPKMRLLEFGYYELYLAEWLRWFPEEQILVMTFEHDIKARPEHGLRTIYGFLGLDPSFVPAAAERKVHGSNSVTRSAINYYLGPARRILVPDKIGRLLDRSNLLERLLIRSSDIEFLRDTYMPRRPALEKLLGRSLDEWDYGARLLGA